MPARSVLVVAAEDAERAYLERQLAEDGFDVLAVGAAEPALALVEREHPDLILLGVSLPDRSGHEVCRCLRAGEPGRRWNRDLGVILVGPGDDPVERVRGFARGADDYVTRPIVYEELLGRMNAVLRRLGGNARRDRLRVGELEIDRLTRVVTVGGLPVELVAREYELLLALASDPERVWTKEELLRDVWGFRSLGRTRTLDSHASRLRRKLNRVGEARYVINVWRVGYRLVQPELEGALAFRLP